MSVLEYLIVFVAIFLGLCVAIPGLPIGILQLLIGSQHSSKRDPVYEPVEADEA